jgi:hypothetical protein
MKKAVLIGALVLSVMAVLACKSQPEPKSAEDELKDLYARYSGALILEGARIYTVVPGDTLSGIAAKSEYRSGFYYPIILLASRDVVVDVDKIEPDMQLIIPDLQKNLDDPKARANIKQFLLEVAKIEDERDRPQTAEGLRKLSDSL